MVRPTWKKNFILPSALVNRNNCRTYHLLLHHKKAIGLTLEMSAGYSSASHIIISYFIHFLVFLFLMCDFPILLLPYFIWCFAVWSQANKKHQVIFLSCLSLIQCKRERKIIHFLYRLFLLYSTYLYKWPFQHCLLAMPGLNGQVTAAFRRLQWEWPEKDIGPPESQERHIHFIYL